MATTQQTLAPPVARTRGRPWGGWSAQERAEARFAFWLVLPAMAAIVLVAFLPLAQTIWLAFWRVNLRFANTPRTFQGLDNFAAILQDGRIFHRIPPQANSRPALWLYGPMHDSIA